LAQERQSHITNLKQLTPLTQLVLA